MRTAKNLFEFEKYSYPNIEANIFEARLLRATRLESLLFAI